MLIIKVPAKELWDERRQEFINIPSTTLSLEHSLVAISKWESKYCKPFLSQDQKTEEELLYYIKCMTLTQGVDENVYLALSRSNIKDINDYIEAPMTATWFSENKNQAGKPSRSSEQITSELIYYWMVALQIPFECQKWHINRLLTLVKICNVKNQPPKKRSQREILQSNAALNAARRKQLGTKG